MDDSYMYMEGWSQDILLQAVYVNTKPYLVGMMTGKSWFGSLRFYTLDSL